MVIAQHEPEPVPEGPKSAPAAPGPAESLHLGSAAPGGTGVGARPGRRVAREDENHIVVKGVVYTKLELVGKGGSCKVFKVRRRAAGRYHVDHAGTGVDWEAQRVLTLRSRRHAGVSRVAAAAVGMHAWVRPSPGKQSLRTMLTWLPEACHFQHASSCERQRGAAGHGAISQDIRHQAHQAGGARHRDCHGLHRRDPAPHAPAQPAQHHPACRCRGEQG